MLTDCVHYEPRRRDVYFPRSLKLYHGPGDGERRAVAYREMMPCGLVAIWCGNDEQCEAYQLAHRYTRLKYGAVLVEVCLVWVPS